MDSFKTKSHVLISCNPQSAWQAAEELRGAGLQSPVWIFDGIALAPRDGDFAVFSARLRAASSVFIRHIAPVDVCLALRGEPSDLDAIRGASAVFGPRIDPSRTFAVQSRLAGPAPGAYRKFDLNKTLSDAIEAETGAPMDARTPSQVVSLLCAGGAAYLGLSDASDNLSDWAGGEHRFRTEDGRISRSEFKLLEAASVFNIRFPESGDALDIGAAPGGWTQVLVAAGMRVVAVDPADLDPRLKRNPAVSHARLRIQDYFPCRRTFDMVVNDMRMEPIESVEIMLEAGGALKPGGLGVMTLKLPESIGTTGLDLVREALERLRWRFDVLGARQLFHNRSEVTVVLKARSGNRRGSPMPDRSHARAGSG